MACSKKEVVCKRVQRCLLRPPVSTGDLNSRQVPGVHSQHLVRRLLKEQQQAWPKRYLQLAKDLQHQPLSQCQPPKIDARWKAFAGHIHCSTYDPLDPSQPNQAARKIKRNSRNNFTTLDAVFFEQSVFGYRAANKKLFMQRMRGDCGRWHVTGSHQFVLDLLGKHAGFWNKYILARQDQGHTCSAGELGIKKLQPLSWSAFGSF